MIFLPFYLSYCSKPMTNKDADEFSIVLLSIYIVAWVASLGYSIYGRIANYLECKNFEAEYLRHHYFASFIPTISGSVDTFTSDFIVLSLFWSTLGFFAVCLVAYLLTKISNRLDKKKKCVTIKTSKIRSKK